MKEINSVILKRLSFLDKKFRENKHVKTSELAKEYEVSEKTLYRDMEFLKSEYSAPIEYDYKTKSYYYSKPFKLNTFDFTVNELYNLAIIRELIKSFDYNPYKTDQQTLFKKLLVSFGDQISSQFDLVKEKVSFKFKPVKKLDSKLFKKIENALFNERRIEVEYFILNENRIEERVIDPYNLRNFEGDWYLIGFDHSKKKVRVLSINRIRNVKLKNQYFEIPEDYDIQKIFKNSFGNRKTSKLYEVVLEINKSSINQILERDIHSSQKIKRLNNGNLQITVKVNELSEIKEWIIKNGPKVKVISPKELVEMIRNEAAAITKLYNSNTHYPVIK